MLLDSALLEREESVQEVKCIDCGTPMTQIPGWYAKVKVRFTCDNCRQKSPRAIPSPIGDLDVRSAVGDVLDPDLEPALEDAVDVDDISVDVDEDMGDVDE